MNQKLTINSTSSLSEAIGQLRQTFKEDKYFQITIATGKARSLPLNAVLHRWCEQVSKEEGEYTAGEIKCLNKYTFFMPIQRGEDPEYSDICEKVLGPLCYEDRIKAMEYWPVTRLMKSKPMLRGMEAMQAHYAGRVQLEFK